MNDTEKKLDVLPGLAAGAALLAIAALVAAVVAIGKSNDKTSVAATGSMAGMGSGSMSGMSAEETEHMGPLPIEGIGDAPSDRGGARLKGTLRNSVLEYTLDARPVWWRVHGKQRLAAYAYNGIVPGPQIRVRNGQRVRIRFKNNLPVETTIHWHGVGVPNSQDGVPGVTQRAIKPGTSFSYEFTAKPAGDPGGGGTFLYHTHVDEDRQMPAGLYGSFIIDAPKAPVRYAVDRTLVFSEWTADASTGRVRGVMQMEGMLPNFFTINGKSYPDTSPVDVPAGKPVLCGSSTPASSRTRSISTARRSGSSPATATRSPAPSSSCATRSRSRAASARTSRSPSRPAGGCCTATSATTSPTTATGPAA